MVQRPDQAKRRQILDSAAELFGSKPFHEVRLDDVAAAAKVGKGTLYVYFAGKEDLYLSLVREGFAEMVTTTCAHAGANHGTVWERLSAVIDGLIRFGTSYPDLYRVMRTGGMTPDDPEIQRTRRKLVDLIEGILRDGAGAGAVCDPHPEITAQFIMSFVRGALLYPPTGLTPRVLEDQIVRILQRGIGSANGNGHGSGAC